MLGLDGAIGRVAVGGIGGVVEERVGRLIPLEVEDAQGLAALDFMDPPVARRDHLAINGLRRIENAVGHGGQKRRA